MINTAAYTAVDAAERDSERAEAVNATGAAHVAEAAQRVGARVLHISTDFVFDGGRGYPYGPQDRAEPLGVYGRTKLAGEREVLRICGEHALVVRTAWLYASHGRNFPLTMLRLMRERDHLGVVADQVGTPTWARALAEALWVGAARQGLSGVHHWTEAGVASWYDFAVAIQEEALAQGLLDRYGSHPSAPHRRIPHPGPSAFLQRAGQESDLGGPWVAGPRSAPESSVDVSRAGEVLTGSMLESPVSQWRFI